MSVRLRRELSLINVGIYILLFLLKDADQCASSQAGLMNKRYLRFRLSRFPAEVPLLPSIEYDFGGLDDFPMRQGFTSKDLKDLDGCSANDAASFVQSWLFFGLLADLTGDFVDRQSILPLSTPQHELDLRTLWHLAKCRPPELRVRMAYGSDKSSSKTLARRISKIVRIGIQNVERIDRLDVAEKHPMPLILLSVKILLCDLAATEIERSGTYSVPWDHEVEDPRLLPCASGPHIMSSSTRALHGQMIARGWCPSQIQRIGSTCDYSMMYHLSTICRGNDGKNTHQICSSTSCQAYNSDPELYVTSHTTPGCQCSFISAPTEQIDEIINSGGVPLVSIHEVSHGKLAIYVHRSKANSNYTAISHVWSGGLGNVQANSLPICQLEYLNSCLSRLPKDGERGLNYKKNKYIRDLSGSVWISPLGLDNLVSSENRKPRLFWIDTLCIPVDPKSSNLRLRAINKMDAIYAQAGEVLVLDSEIQRLSIGNTHPCELLAHLAYSSWMTRSWTLQEGAIGRAAYFQCADGALTLERPRSYFAEQSALSLVILAFRAVVSIVRHRAVKVNYSERTTGPGMGHERTEDFLLNLLLDSLHRGRNVSMMGDIGTTGLVPDDMRLDSFVSIWNDLSQRSTTKPEDMFAIFANLLDFNAGQITRVPRDERMKAILWSSDSIPFSLLYNTGPRLKDGKNIRDKWVPTVPKGSRLANSPSMKWAVDGRSLCLTTQDDETPPLAVTAQVDSLPLYCYLIDDGSDQMYFIKAVRSDIDAVSTVNHEAICVIIESSSSGTARGSNLDYASKLHGACFFVVSSKQSATLTSPSPERSQVQHSETLENHRLSLTTVYDCPVRVWAVEDVESVPESEKGAVESLDGPVCCPIVRCRGFTTDYELHLETDTPRLEKPFARRTLPTNPSLLVLNALVVLSLLFIFSNIIPLTFFAIQAVQEDGHFTPLGYAAIVCFSLSFPSLLLNLPPAPLLAPVSAILITIDRTRRHDFNAVTIAYVALTFGGLVPGALWALLWDVMLRDYAQEAWLATFDEDWDTNGYKKYQVWWWIFGVNVRVARALRAAGEMVQPNRNRTKA